MHPLVSRVLEVPGVTSLVDGLEAGRPPAAGGLWGSSSALITAALYRRLGRPALLVLPTVQAADEAEEDLATFLGSAPERLPEHDPHDPVAASARVRAVRRVREGALVVASARALLQELLPEGPSVRLAKGMEFGREKLLRMLGESALERTHAVELPGEYAVRGGIIDLHPFGLPHPLRIEFAGEKVESVRIFEVGEQRTEEMLEEAEFTLTPEGGGGGRLDERLPGTAWVGVREPSEINEEGWLERLEALRRRPLVMLQSLPGEGENFRTLTLQRFSGSLSSLAAELKSLAADEVRIFCATRGEEERLSDLLRDAGAGAGIRVERGRLNQGFVFREIAAAVVPNHELFNRYRLRRAPRMIRTRAIDNLLELEPDDLVVHLTHGIGRFLRVESLKGQEHLVLGYEGGARLYVPASNIDLVQKYLGGGERGPSLSKLGGKAWTEAKARAEKSAEKLAEEMLRVQALREARPGISYAEDGPWQRAFEAAFPYEETDDQLEAARQMRLDMAAPRPADRLLCGDVGYGKTELAMRAAFRAAAAGKQVAVLVPTTVLAQQHYTTFRERMADYPFEIRALSRFRSKAEQRAILDGLAEGKVDIVIGTHRLIQSDVRFRDLGLVIIDEEQRFGVDHKERLKRLRAAVDVFTLTATPIPRTLHMALLGIRDITSLATPPQDRRSIVTEVIPCDERRIAAAVRFELARGGQAYFVHNRVWNIGEVARRLERLVPEARIAIGHGQMNEHELEETMLRFLAGEVDVLVCTTIIESGLDIPNVNTILINETDRFGLADLHQLRGRVGRYKVQAYCYLVLPEGRPVLPQAKKRIKAVEEFSELGSGFKIARRDLEIRGVGNLLGREQHGHIAAVGYELYCRMLERSVRAARKEKPPAEPVETVVELGVEAHLPESYIPDVKTRIDVYRRLSVCGDMRELDAARREVEDRFGRMTGEVESLLKVFGIRLLARAHGFTSVTRGRDAVVCRYRDASKARALARRRPDEVRVVDSETVHLVVRRGPLLDEALRILA